MNGIDLFRPREAHDRTRRDRPRFMEGECDAFLECGTPSHDFRRLRCAACGHDNLLASSCNRLEFCPSCGARRMLQTATVVDTVYR